MGALVLALTCLGFVAFILMFVFMIRDNAELVGIAYLVCISFLGLVVLLGFISLIILSYGGHGTLI